MTFHSAPQRTGAVAVMLLAAACAPDRRSPTCGIALLVGPTMIQEQLRNPRLVLTEAPRGLPETLPARVIGHPQGRVAVSYADGDMTGRFDGPAFPQTADSLNGYALLVADDTSQRVQGILIYESSAPRNHPRLGLVSSGDRSLPLYGVRVDWLSLSNPKCPLLGDTAATP